MTLQIVLRQSNIVKKTKQVLEEKKLLSKTRKIQKQGDEFIITTATHDLDQIPLSIKNIQGVKFIETELEELEAEANPLRSFVISKLKDDQISDEIKLILLEKIPKKWTIYPPLLLINNQDTFESKEWIDFFSNHDVDKSEFFKDLLRSCFGETITHIAVNKPIVEQDIMRRPFSLLSIHGEFGPDPTSLMYDNPTEDDFKNAFWCSVVQNGIYQTWAPRYTMFSRGNIKEKKRILETFGNIRGNCVVDLYAGIGYFTLSYLQKGAKHLFCFELNPWSIQGLARGVQANGYSYKLIKHEDQFVYDPNVQVFIFNESNEFAESRFKEMRGVQLPISHINLGLLPSSKTSWSIAESLFFNFSASPTCDIHIHENVHVADLQNLLNVISSELLQIAPSEDIIVEPLHLEKIKTFAPDIWHICADFKLIKLDAQPIL